MAVVDREALEEEGAEAEPGHRPALKTKPWRPVQLSKSLRMRSRTRSTISLPMV